MGKKNFYAVKSGRQKGIFRTWAECSANVSGYPGAKFKGFETFDEAKNYMGSEYLGNEVKINVNVTVGKPVNVKTEVTVGYTGGQANVSTEVKAGYDVEPIKSRAKVKSSKEFIDPSELRDKYDFIAYVDGSYDNLTKTYGSGVIVLGEGDEYEAYSESGHDEWDQWNIVGELEATKLAIGIAEKQGAKSVAIYHDLKNIALWATGEWRAKNRYTQEYVRFMEDASKRLDIYFVKVKGHSKEYYNELADKAAKNAIGM